MNTRVLTATGRPFERATGVERDVTERVEPDHVLERVAEVWDIELE